MTSRPSEQSESPKAGAPSNAKRSSQQLAMPLNDASSLQSPDGFSRVHTRQPFTLETT